MKRGAPMKRTPMKRSAPLRSAGPARATVKVRKCAVKTCRQPFVPRSMTHKACGPECAEIIGRAEAEKKALRAALEDRKKTRAQLRALEPLQKFLQRAQDAVNRYVRARDYRQGCISCDLPHDWDGQWHASHLRTVKTGSAVRFNLWNIHRGCWICNKLYSGRVDAYRPKVTERIGAGKVDWLYTQNQVMDYSREYLERMARVFNKKAARQEKRNAVNA